ncbi:MAG: 2-oxoglutarate dehydrogenase E1 component, partial [Anaerolineales bacterium]
MSWLDDFHGPNAAYADRIRQRYLEDPSAVDPESRAYLAGLASAGLEQDKAEKFVAAASLAQAIRDFGHLAANLDPLGSEPTGDPALEPSHHGLSGQDLKELPAWVVGGVAGGNAGDADEAIFRLREIYCGRIGFDFRHVREPSERSWLRKSVERRVYSSIHEAIDGVGLLTRLTSIEAFEQFLHRIFPGRHRFSIEGLDMMVPMLDELIRQVQGTTVDQVLLGMAHRGRLNVMAHVLCMPYKQILAKFADPLEPSRFLDDLSWTGDVKYHQGAARAVEDAGDEQSLTIHLSPNPSHVESINPVIEGRARAAGTARADRGTIRFDPSLTLPVLIHGDAGFAGQGVVAETLNLAGLTGYYTGGTIHFIANNQLGYTTDPDESRSTLHASDLAKGFKIPVLHVNADAPEDCLEAIRLAWAYRQEFHKDVLINIVGYRRYGHNEGDEPSFTQPVMYDKVRNHSTIREQWAERMIACDQVEAARPEAMLKDQMSQLQQVYEQLDPAESLPTQAEKVGEGQQDSHYNVETTVSSDVLKKLNAKLIEVPEGFSLHPKLEKVLAKRKGLFDSDGGKVDWTTAEQLAFASILKRGMAIRITGEDTERGTFSQRHAVFHDHENGEIYVPLRNIDDNQAAFEIYNSPLTENAVLAFEYGYDLEAQETLVIWEAQYGDFANGAQITLDEFVLSSRAKWGVESNLVLLLPHGYEGAGPNHSSARIERFLTLAVDDNIRAANCTTASQYFHLLRLQAELQETSPRPLVIFTPKSLLRHPMVSVSTVELTEGGWQPVLTDMKRNENGDQIERLILCSGKIGVDLLASDAYERADGIAILRLEQLAPFPAEALEAALDDLDSVQSYYWVQEEPENMGPWPSLRPELTKLIGQEPRFIGRPASPSPAEGSSAWHKHNQEALIE